MEGSVITDHAQARGIGRPGVQDVGVNPPVAMMHNFHVRGHIPLPHTPSSSPCRYSDHLSMHVYATKCLIIAS